MFSFSNSNVLACLFFPPYPLTLKQMQKRNWTSPVSEVYSFRQRRLLLQMLSEPLLTEKVHQYISISVIFINNSVEHRLY